MHAEINREQNQGAQENDMPPRCGNRLDRVSNVAYATAGLLLLLMGCTPASPISAPEPLSSNASESTAISSPAPAEEASGNGKSNREVHVQDGLVQYSLLAALAAGDYTSGVPLHQVLREGDFGVGTFDRLDGELILVDGKIYQGLANGVVRPANLDGKTPFAAVKFFVEDGRIESLSASTLEELDERLDRELPRRNAPYAIRIDGNFKELRLRSVPAQSPPFRPLVEVVKEQSTYTLKDVAGSLVGFRCPAWVGTLNVAGYHWHFLSEDRQAGGHVFGCEFQAALLRYDECKSMLIRIPEAGDFDHFSADAVDKQDINQIERQRK